MRSETRSYTTGDREVVLDMTTDCADFCAEQGGDGLLHVFVPHATAGVAVIETGAGSDADLLAALGDLLPADDRWRHQHGSPGHGRSHVMPALVAPYATVPVLGGRLQLGTWQSICLVDLNIDNPEREVRLSFLEGDPGYYGSRGFERAAQHGCTPASARTPAPACQVICFEGREEWMTGQLVYRDIWWRHDAAGLRDPLLAEIESALEVGNP